MSHLLTYRIGSLQKPHLPLAQVAEMGIQGLELVWNDETTVDQVEAAVEKHGLRVTSLSVQCPLEDDDLPETLGQRASHAAALGATYMFVSAHAGDMPKQEAYERLRRLGDAVGPHQVYLAMETHPDLCQNAANMLETMAGVNHPWVGINYDTANVYYYNPDVDTLTELEQVTAHVRGVHFKETHGNFKESNFPVFGEGIVDFAAVDQMLTSAGYAGPYAMELEGPNFDPGKPEELAEKVARCVAHLQKVGAA